MFRFGQFLDDVQFKAVLEPRLLQLVNPLSTGDWSLVSPGFPMHRNHFTRISVDLTADFNMSSALL